MGFVLVMPDVPEFAAFGKSQEEAIENAKKNFPWHMAIWHHIKERPTLRPSHHAPEPPAWRHVGTFRIQRTERKASGKFTLRLPAALHASLRQCAASEGVSVRTMAATLLAAALQLPAAAPLRPPMAKRQKQRIGPPGKATAIAIHVPTALHQRLIQAAMQQRATMSLLATTLLAQQIAAWEAAHSKEELPARAGT